MRPGHHRRLDDLGDGLRRRDASLAISFGNSWLVRGTMSRRSGPGNARSPLMIVMTMIDAWFVHEERPTTTRVKDR
jgi:hypothetical protein